ncbi:MAG: hypothetical protein HY560_03650 [Gemmatimonadetes bacterium]|nr:hypothetical protein [Gemmatimonadota bacterium]
MAPFAAVLAILAICAVMALLLRYVDGLKMFAPRSTERLAGSAQVFCHDTCRLADGNCPLIEVRLETSPCPLWRFVQARLPTDLRASPFRSVGPAVTAGVT